MESVVKPKLLWIGDAACPSGFARATHEVANVLKEYFEIMMIGINYRGDPHEYPYPIYTAMAGGDFLGVGRLIWMCDFFKPDVIVVQNDPWNVVGYTDHLKQFPEHAKIPVIGFVAVDGKNCRGADLNGLALGIFWTQFGLDEARAGGFTKPGVVIPLGVDLKNYYPVDRKEARARLKLPLPDAFIVGNVNRNQPRKRWDLTLKYFAAWIKSCAPKDAYLMLHTAPTGDTGCDVEQLANYYDIVEHVILIQPPVWYGISEADMRDTYNSFNVQISTTQGEGFGLTTFEGMACGIPQIVPDWAALGELCRDAVSLIPCTSTAIGPPYLNVIGGVADEEEFVRALDALYRSEALRKSVSESGLERVNEERFRWENIGQAFCDVAMLVIGRKKIDVTTFSDAQRRYIYVKGAA